MENVLIKRIDFIENVTIYESDNLNNFLESINQNVNDCLIIKNKNTIRLYSLNNSNCEDENTVSALKIEGVGVRSNLAVIPLVLEYITKSYSLLDLFTNETSICFIINKCDNKNFTNQIKDIFIKEGFDVQ